jgi:hypothetical protein
MRSSAHPQVSTSSKSERHYQDGEAERDIEPIPLPYVGILDNNKKKRYRLEYLKERLEREGYGPRVQLLSHSIDRP